jgi:hypothetical protein
MPDLLLPIFHLQSLPSQLPSTTITTWLLHQQAFYPSF